MPVALKLFHPAHADSRRIAREIETLQKVSCPTLVRVVAATNIVVSGTTCHFIAYELLAGPDLRAHLVPGRMLDAHELAAVGMDVGGAIEALWANRIVHRDVKPANIMRTASGRFVLVDIGLARHVDRSTLTLAGRTAGTLGYMSPEQARGRRSLTIASDVFSLGVTIYELAAGSHPFGGDQNRIGVTSPLRLESMRGDLPRPLTQLVDQMLLVPPYLRPTNPSERFRQLGI